MASGSTAQRSTKHCQCNNNYRAEVSAVHKSTRLEALPEVCALAFAFSTAHIQRAALRCAQHSTARSISQRAAPRCTRRCIARSIVERPALHRAACSTVSRVGVWAGPQTLTLRSGKRGFGGSSPRLPRGGERSAQKLTHTAKHCRVPGSRQHALRRRSRAQRQAGVLRSVQRSTAGVATTRNASRGVRASICFQQSVNTARSATLQEALHCAQRCTARSIVKRPVLTAVSPPQKKPSAAVSGGTAQRSTKHCQCSSDTKRFRRCAR